MYGAPAPMDLNLMVHPAAGVSTPPEMSSPGLLRYRSAPSTLLGDLCGDFLPAAGAGTGHFEKDASSMASQHRMYQSQQQMAAMEGLYCTASSGGADAASGNTPLQQSSSHAGFFNHLNIDNGYGKMLRAGMEAAAGFRNGDARLKGQRSFSSRQGSVMPQISEMASEELGGGSPEAGGNGGAYSSSVPDGYLMEGGGGASSGCWEEHASPSPSLLSADNLISKRPRDAADPSPSPAPLPPSRLMKQQRSLPTSSTASPEIAAIERFLQLQDGSAPSKIRAKRGCATNPRSIAERVRRSKISEGIQRLQELVPKMEKQTNTSDMLDLAVDYVKELQMQVKVLKHGRASCTCTASSRQLKHFAC